MTEPARDQSKAATVLPDAEIHVEFEICRSEGTEAERLRLEQASVLKEVTEWLTARRQSEPGRDRAA